ncbi:hypothetical protein [Stakelama saccharophila]|uniref:Uncharacterized protein n=1 Tax=Stakelama saccharophila TaxID=3075605 RepID=A0ABZ0B857_9SPHN|nr:hypothetical protein [Stakelama sp. W311]WNO53601.1 hypothetical protein RPR59_14370 [Stakelama sp. W311]
MLMILLLPVGLLLATLFGRNALIGLRTGVIYAQSHRIERKAQPINFWIAVVFSIAFATVSVAMVGVASWAIVAFG